MSTWTAPSWAPEPPALGLVIYYLIKAGSGAASGLPSNVELAQWSGCLQSAGKARVGLPRTLPVGLGSWAALEGALGLSPPNLAGCSLWALVQMGDSAGTSMLAACLDGSWACTASVVEQGWSVHGVAWQWGLFTSRLVTRTKESMVHASGMV